jgi:NAD(P)H-dependent FMN reductase
MLNLKIVVGSTRDGRAADPVVAWVLRHTRAAAAFDLDVLDLREWNLPMFAETIHTIGDFTDPSYSQPVVRRWNHALATADAVLIVTPEYNHSVPAVLKNALDSVFFSFALRHKPVGLVGYSAGQVGGARSVEHLVHVLVEAEAVPMRNTVLVPKVHEAFDAGGEPVLPATTDALSVLLEDLGWWGQVLADARPASLPPAMIRNKMRAERRVAS